MVRRLVDEEAARVLLVGVPAAEIVGAMPRVEIPVEIDRGDIADHLLEQQFLDARSGGGVAIIEGDVDAPAGAALGFHDALRLGRGGRHRLFGDDVNAGFERLDDDVVMGVVGCRYDDPLRAHLGEHLVHVGIDRGLLRTHRVARAAQAQRVGVADADHFNRIAPAFEKLLAPHAGAAMAGADQGNPMLVRAVCHAVLPRPRLRAPSFQGRHMGPAIAK